MIPGEYAAEVPAKPEAEARAEAQAGYGGGGCRYDGITGAAMQAPDAGESSHQGEGTDCPDTVARTASESILPSAVQMAPCEPQS